MSFQLHSDRLGFFPLLVNGVAPPAAGVFTPVPSDPTLFSVAMGVMPAGGPDAGDPAVVVTALTRAGALGLTFTVTDSAGDTAATETFDIIPPAVVAGAISVDETNIVSEPNANPPTV